MPRLYRITWRKLSPTKSSRARVGRCCYWFFRSSFFLFRFYSAAIPRLYRTTWKNLSPTKSSRARDGRCLLLADVCHAYQILREGGLKDENIVVFMYDDISSLNLWPGVIINNPMGV